MNQYSEIVGSFLRNGPFSLEADYVFESEEALLQFYSEPENKAIVHQGWFKIVGEGENQALYWVVKEGDDLKFVKFLEKIDRDSIYSDLGELSKKLNDEIKERKEADAEIWGDKEGVISDLNNIEELSKGVDELRAKVGEAISDLSAIVKGDNSLELEEIEDYLKQLDYPSIKDLSEVLYKFLNDIDESDERINTLLELQDFLDGYKDTDKLRDILQNLRNSILGNVDQGTTLESLRRHLLDLIQALNNRCHNLQTELDQTQVGVGLSGDGAYNADKETYYLKDATSVMNALKILDRLLHRQNNITYVDTDSVELVDEVDEDDNTRTVSANVKVAKDSDIIIKDNNGIYHKVSLKEENGEITLYVNGEVRDQFNIGISPLLEDGYYDEHTEKLILIFKLHNSQVQRVEIPVDKLITEWVPGNTLSITLNKNRVIDGPDVLTADLNVSKDTDNGISVRGDGVFASRNAKDLLYKERSVEAAIEDLETSMELVEEDLEQEISRAKAKEQELSEELQTETERAARAEQELDGRISELESQVDNIENDILEIEDEIEEIQQDRTDDLDKITELQDKLNGHDLDELEEKVENIENTLEEDLSNIIGEEVNIENFEGEDARPIVIINDEVDINIKAGKYYRFDNLVDTLNITLPTLIDNKELRSIILFFTTNDSPAVTISSDQEIKYFSGYGIDPNTTYELNIMFNGTNWIVAYGIIE